VRIALPSEKAEQLADYKEKSAIVGIRPEDLKPAQDHFEGKTIQGTVEVVEPIGNETYVDLNAGSFNPIAAAGRKSQIKPHRPLVLNPTMKNLHLFEIESEEAIF
jgi:multiple sugar transport system ATP-binding protein